MPPKKPDFHDIFKKYLPLTLSPIPEDTVLAESPTCLDESKKPLTIGLECGALKVEAFSNSIYSPYILSCVCGRRFRGNKSLFLNQRHCGCFHKAVRMAYLIRMRIEALRVWMGNIQDWLADMKVIQEYMVNFLTEAGAVADRRRKVIAQVEKGECVPDLHHTAVDFTQQEFLDFWFLVSPPTEYAKWLKQLAKHAREDYPLWESIPITSLDGYEDLKNELPEFDAASFINLINMLVANESAYYEPGTEKLAKFSHDL